jgi:hypothetical protein
VTVTVHARGHHQAASVTRGVSSSAASPRRPAVRRGYPAGSQPGRTPAVDRVDRGPWTVEHAQCTGTGQDTAC